MIIPYKIGDKVKCSCGCGGDVIIKYYHVQPYNIREFGLKRYIHGHNGDHVRVSRQFWDSMTVKQRKEFGQKKSRKLKERGWVNPQIGKTKENNEGVRRTSEKMKQTKNSKKWKDTIGKQCYKKMSIQQKQMVKDGTFIRQGVTTIGSNHSTLFKKGKSYDEIYGKERELEERKKRSASHQDISLSEWTHFTGFEPYDDTFTEKRKRNIRKRDNQVCMNCGIHRERLGGTMVVHHVNYDKMCSIEQNCITLCNRCHPLTNHNREYWQELFQNKLAQLYGYEYINGMIVIKLEKGGKNEMPEMWM